MIAKLVKFFATLLFLGVLALSLTLLQEESRQGNKPASIVMSLVRPALAQEVEADFLEQEAGISAYTNLGRKMDIVKVETVFRTIEAKTSMYIAGSIPVPGYEKYVREDAHCFIHSDGWIVAYYLKDEPTAKAVNWQELDNSKLEVVLTIACNSAGSVLPPIGYYNFEYPDATKLSIVAKHPPRPFRLLIPDSFTIYERSWSTPQSSGSVEIDGTRISESLESGEYGTYGLITFTQLGRNEFHTVKPYSGSSCAIVLVYRES